MLSPAGPGRAPGATRRRSRHTTSSSSAAAAMASPPPTTSPRNHGIRNVAVLEKGYIGSGNAGRNTTIVRSNYLLPGDTAVLRFLAEALGRPVARAQLQRDVLASAGSAQLLHSPGAARRGCAARQHDAPATASTPKLLDARGVQALVPHLDSGRARVSRSRAGSCSRAAAPRATMRSPGAMRARRRTLGVDIIQHCEVTGFRSRGRRVVGRRDGARAHQGGEGRPRGRRAYLAARRDGRLRLPIESHVLQAFVSEPLKPLLDTSSTFGGRAFLYQPVGQGRPGLRRRSRRLQFLRAARQSAGGRGRRGAGGLADAVPRRACGCCAIGAASWT